MAPQTTLIPLVPCGDIYRCRLVNPDGSVGVAIGLVFPTAGRGAMWTCRTETGKVITKNAQGASAAADRLAWHWKDNS